MKLSPMQLKQLMQQRVASFVFACLQGSRSDQIVSNPMWDSIRRRCVHIDWRWRSAVVHDEMGSRLGTRVLTYITKTSLERKKRYSPQLRSAHVIFKDPSRIDGSFCWWFCKEDVRSCEKVVVLLFLPLRWPFGSSCDADARCTAATSSLGEQTLGKRSDYEKLM